MEEMEQLKPVVLTHLFNMKLMTGMDIQPCEVYKAMLSDGTWFTRLVINPRIPKSMQIIDVDHKGGEWLDMYTGEPSVWSELVAPCLDFQMSFRENLLHLN